MNTKRSEETEQGTVVYLPFRWKIEVCIKWKGSDVPTWEPLSNLSFYQQLSEQSVNVQAQNERQNQKTDRWQTKKEKKQQKATSKKKASTKSKLNLQSSSG